MKDLDVSKVVKCSGEYTAKPYKKEEFEYGEPIKFFHKLDENDDIQYQGFVDSINSIGGGTVVLFDFIMGDMRTKTVVTPDYFKKCAFYDSNAEMNGAYERAEHIKKYGDDDEEDSLPSGTKSIKNALLEMNAEIDTSWEQREVRGIMSVMWKFTNEEATYFLAAPAGEDDPLSYITKSISEDHGKARWELNHLLK